MYCNLYWYYFYGTNIVSNKYTAIPYRASTGPEQGFPCVVFPHREKPVFITGFPGDGNRFFPVGKSTQGKPCFHYRDGFAVNKKGLEVCHVLMKKTTTDNETSVTAEKS